MDRLKERIQLERVDRRVLSIQSHVVSGYAGNKCAVFPMQLHGFEVDVINSVQFSNHTGHENGIRGQRLTSNDLTDLFEGLKINTLTDYSHVLTGYCGDAGFLRKIVQIVKELKQTRPELTFLCDPVLGDNGSYYAPKELMPIYRDEVLPVADILTPNIFELSQLTGLPCETEADCLKAIGVLHDTFKIPIVVVSSAEYATQDTKILHCYASKRDSNGITTQFRYEIPRIPGAYVGTGDIFSSLLLVWLSDLNGNVELAVKNVILSLQALLKKTFAKAYGTPADLTKKPTAKEREIMLIESRYDILVPCGEINYQKL